MIKETIRASGRFQVEVTSDYKLEHERRNTTYTIETYAFIPNSLDVNRESYPKYLFYRDTLSYIRFRIPSLLLRDLAAADSEVFAELDNSLRGLTEAAAAARVPEAENRLRLFCCLLKAAIKDHIALVAAAATPADADYLVEHYRDALVQILDRFRKLGRALGQDGAAERVRAIHALADEYSSICAEQYSFDILEKTRRFGSSNSGGYRGRLLRLIRQEQKYRREQGYPSIAEPDSKNESFIYRRGVLKRLMESILFLNTRVRPEGMLTEQIIYSLAAGLAMVFATAVAFMTQQKYGNFTLAFFVALVVSYMFKDRIKELARLYINRKVQDHYFDRKVHIHGGPDGEQLGYCRESFRFVAEDALPQAIRELRNRDPITRFDNEQLGERVFVYRKQMTVLSRRFKQVYHGVPVDGLTDIWRVSMARFVRKMDDPRKPLFMLDDDGYRLGKASKVYHINLVIKYVDRYGTEYKRFRIVLNRDGIRRIEQVAAG